MRPTLSSAEIDALAYDLPQWTLEPGGLAITRHLEFKDFKTAFTFMTEVAEAADRLDHHPEWSNVYNRVSIRLTTHDSKGLTARDIVLARAVDAAASD
ncbi:4a-hydroxytetrahydrobiopterin dehydratase [Asticcacaulis sp. 201]|uniref:4a-hydroxytetrahydrobiopterin dehydratase n=1 Tax=Asticcacaulis sp. 201 TaxID=3028787 RepID=UPI002915DDF3|nr:4a-hydroxytetrahydrobiopterin dehydratase [Asticcacaulis sp. 201]MDV6332238.1 4a-hydroxytetrahydrobiopterin dehydratase [Asticcacaulis sp. 201]